MYTDKTQILEEGEEYGLRTWPLVASVGDQDAVFGAWLMLGTDLAAVANWAMNQQVEDFLSLCTSLCN